MKNNIKYSCLLFLFCSCRISTHLETSFDGISKSMIIQPIAMQRMLGESIIAIYQKDSLQQKTPIYIHNISACFTSDSTYFELKLDSIQATLINDTLFDVKRIIVMEDSILYNEVRLPDIKKCLLKDTFDLNVICEYLPDMNIKSKKNSYKCLKARYIVNGLKVSEKEGFKECR